MHELWRYSIESSELVQIPDLPRLSREPDRIAIADDGIQFLLKADEPLQSTDNNGSTDVYLLRSTEEELNGLMFPRQLRAAPRFALVSANRAIAHFAQLRPETDLAS